MSRYLDLARAAEGSEPPNSAAERNEENEIRVVVASPQYERNEENEESPGFLDDAEVRALGLNPVLRWMHVSREEIEATAPPPGWDGTLPQHCRWSNLCRVLGPCPHAISGCRRDQGDAA